MINGYPDQTSVFPGSTITFHVSTDAPQFRIETYRQGEDLALLLVSDWLAGVNAPDHDADEDWGVDSTRNDQLRSAWPNYDLEIPADWRSGVFIAMFVEGDGSGNERGNTPPLDRTSADARSGKGLFVVRDAAPGVNARILYKLPLFTYQAYNFAGGWSLYQSAPVSMRRPGGGTGGNPWDFLSGFFNPGNPDVPLQTFAQWDAPFIAWLERGGYVVDYVTDLDLHFEDGLLTPYSLILSVGLERRNARPSRRLCCLRRKFRLLQRQYLLVARQLR
jgi:hypothetical protein